MVVLSKSSLNTFLICPKLYEFLYVQKLRSTTSKAAQRGIDVHQFCCDYYDHITTRGEDLLVDKKWLKERMTIATEEAKPFIENFLNFEKERWEVCKKFKPKDTNLYFFPRLKEKKIRNLGLKIVGIIDRVDLNFDDETYTICDYKTEKFSLKSWKLSEHRREMAFYKKLLESSNFIDGEVTHFCIYYPRSNDVWTDKFNWRTLRALERNLEKVRKKISIKHFPTRVSYYCRYCNCNNICLMEI